MTDDDETPKVHPLWLDEGVARWLHTEADAYFLGNVEAAMNYYLRATMDRQAYWRNQPADSSGNPPRDPWERLIATLPPRNERRPPR
jgi:hypothetical protein